VTICAGRLAGAGCEWPRIERDGERLERPMSSSGLWWADDDDDSIEGEVLFFFSVPDNTRDH
jgi:hypothetical protein